jgi:PadR family transcriptional regulator PadR
MKGDRMENQMKRGLLDVCVLAAIKDADSYGYQIIKDMSPYVEISESTLYPILRRLEAGALLTVRSEEYNGRLRKYYHITPEGLKRIETFKEEWKEIMMIYEFVTKEGKKDE